MKISHLVTIGDSFTYCQGLSDPLNESWPVKVAKHFNLPLVNLGRQGAGNDSIYRRTCEYIYKDLNKNSRPFFIVAFTQAWRKEEWYNKHYNNTANNCFMTLALSKEATGDYYERGLFENWNDYGHIRRKFLFMASTIQALKAHNLPYLITDYSSTYDEEAYNKLKKKFFNMYFYVINDRNKIKDFDKLVKNYPKTECGHDGLEAQEVLSNYVISKIVELYENLTILNQVNGKNIEFSTVKNFIDDTEANEANYSNIWYKND